MNKWLAALVALGVALPPLAQTLQPASAATTDPLTIIYRVAGVADDGGAGLFGYATSFMCTNVSPVPEKVRFRVLDKFGAALGVFTLTLTSNESYTASTHLSAWVFDDHLLSDGVAITQGSAIIYATSPKVICTAMIVDSAADAPVGIPLHMVRYNAIPNTLE